MIALLVVSVLAFPVARFYARRVESSAGEPVDKVHRLRRASLVSLLVLAAAMALGRFERPLDARLLGDATRVVWLVAIPVVLIAFMLATQAAIRPSYERVRAVEGTTRGAPRRLTRMLVVLLVPQALWFSAVFLLIRLDAHPAIVIAAALGFMVSMAVSGPLIVRAAMPTRSPDPSDAARLQRLCARHDVAVREVRVLDTRHDPTANAMFSGFGPGPKYIYVTDKLLEGFDDDELAAVLAHEIGHRKLHHIGIKLAAHVGTLLAVALLVTGTAYVLRDSMPGIVPAIVLPLLMVGSVLLVQGTLGVRLEHRADDYAVATVGPEALRRALDKLADFNMTKRDTGWLWNVMHQHPGMDSRLGRLPTDVRQPSGAIT